MLKKYFVFLLLAFNIGLHARPQFLDNIRLKTGEVADFFLGSGTIAEEDQKLIKELKEKLDLKQEIPIRNMSLLAKIFQGYENGYALFPGIFDRVYLNKKWLKELSPDEKKFLFSRALTDVKNQNAYKFLALYCLQHYLSEHVRIMPYLLTQGIKRQIHKNTDLEAAALLGSGQGGAELMQNMRQFKFTGPWYRKLHALANKIVYPIITLPIIKWFTMDKPTLEARAEYLQEA